MDNINVCAYCRVSTKSDTQIDSFENQKIFFDRELRNKKGLKLYKIYADEGITATSFHKREQFNDMMCDAGLDIQEVRAHRTSNNKKNVYLLSNRTPKFKYIYVKNSSRFARNIEVVGILRLLKQKGVYVYFMDLNKSTENDADEMLLQFIFSMDENDSRDKSRKVKWGHLESAKNTDRIHCNSKIYGYKLLKDKNKLIKKEEEAKVVKKIFELYSKRNGIRRIINYLEEHNIKTRKGKKWSKSTIANMLRNEKYAGISARNKWSNGKVFNKHNPKIKPKNEWIIKKTDRIEPIISEELFNKCQKLRENNISTKTQKGMYHSNREFAGLIKCSKCENSYTRNNDRGKVFYNCSNKKVNGVKACNSRNLYQTELEEEIELYRQRKYKEDIELFLNLNKENIQKYKQKLIKILDKNEVEKDIEEKKATLYIYKEKLNKLLDVYLNSDSNTIQETFKTKQKGIEEKIKTIESEIDFLKNKDSKIKKSFQMLDYLESCGNNIYQNCVKNEPLTRKYIVEHIEYINVTEKSLDIYFTHNLLFSVLNCITTEKSYNTISSSMKNSNLVQSINKIKEYIGKIN